MIAVSRNNESIPTMEEKRAAVDEIVSSQTLGRSDQLKAFLHFVCESEINGSGAELNEYLIGVQVLGRPEGYSTSDDATVRTRAHALRRKLLDYYLLENPNAEIRVELPKGSYCPSFARTEPTHFPPPAAVPPARLRRVGLALATAALISSAAFYIGYRTASPPLPQVLTDAWAPFLASDSNVLVCVATPFHLLIRPGPPEAESNLYRPIPDSPEITAWYKERQQLLPGQKLFMNFGHNSPMYGDVAALLITSRLLDQARVPFEVLPERVVTPFEMRNRNVLVLGRPEYSRAAKLVLDKAWFGLSYNRLNDGISVWYPNPTPDQPSFLHHSKQRYGLITVMPSDGENGERYRTIVISGTNSAAAHAAAEFLASPTHLQRLKERFRAEGVTNWPKAWQVVVQSGSEQMLPLDVAYHSHRIIAP
ncbi:MAG: hypothetical protein NTV52_23250 [Acidobacteria bacterium]|nr:hypothetical protein [Acidobacteriota bacterium]